MMQAEQQRGSTLMIGLIILFVLTLLGLNTVDMVITEVGMVEIEQADNRAFAGAEQLINSEIRRSDIMPLQNPGMLANEPAHQDVSVADPDGVTLMQGSSETFYMGQSVVTGSSIGMFGAYLFESTATAESGRSGNAVVRSGFYIQGPSS